MWGKDDFGVFFSDLRHKARSYDNGGNENRIPGGSPGLGEEGREGGKRSHASLVNACVDFRSNKQLVVQRRQRYQGRYMASLSERRLDFFKSF